MIVLQTVSTDYRQPIWQALAEQTDGSVLILAGSHYFDPTIVTRHADGSRFIKVQNRYLLGRRVLVQRLPLRILLGRQPVIAELNPRILSTWLLVGLRRVLNRRTVLWGHVFSSRGTDSAEDRVRQVFRHLAQTIAVYSHRERAALAKRMPRKDIVVAPNGLLARGQMTPRPGAEVAQDFIYVGRLVEAKRPDLLVDAFLSAIDGLAPASRLLMVGDGPLREPLERQVTSAGAESRVRFFGHVNGLEELRRLYETALASVSPGYVGLSITQSLAFGVPMVIADGEPHSPEIEAAEPDLNCVFFTAGSASALADALLSVDHDADDWRSRAEAISENCRSRYSVETTAERLLAACRPPGDRPSGPTSATEA